MIQLWRVDNDVIVHRHIAVCVVTKVNLDLKERTELPEIGPDTRACRDLKECLETKVSTHLAEGWIEFEDDALLKKVQWPW